MSDLARNEFLFDAQNMKRGADGPAHVVEIEASGFQTTDAAYYLTTTNTTSTELLQYYYNTAWSSTWHGREPHDQQVAPPSWHFAFRSKILRMPLPQLWPMADGFYYRHYSILDPSFLVRIL